MNELLREVERIGKIITNDVEIKALEEGAGFLQDKIKENAYTYGLVRRSGDLEKGILKSEVENGKIEVGITNQGDGFYGYFHELGTSKMPPHPFVQPTFENNKQNIEKIMSEVISKELRL
jgi:HK97 gp10 family phage protein